MNGKIGFVYNGLYKIEFLTLEGHKSKMVRLNDGKGPAKRGFVGLSKTGPQTEPLDSMTPTVVAVSNGALGEAPKHDNSLWKNGHSTTKKATSVFEIAWSCRGGRMLTNHTIFLKIKKLQLIRFTW